MEFRILGPLEVVDADRQVTVGAGKQRALLALLLLSANRVVPSERLIDELWGEAPPVTAAKSVQVYVSQLRKVLRNGNGDGRDGPLLTRAGGYVLQVGAGDLDLYRFERSLDEGRRALDGDAPERAAARLREALGLWRGRALQDFAYEPFAQSEIARLEDLRLVALEARIEADLACGRHAEVVGELEALVGEHPLRERLRGQLVLALYRCDRQAHALESYRDGRRRMVEELGLEPSPGLQRLERAILDQSPELAPPTRARPQRASIGPRPPPRSRLSSRRVALLVAGGGGLLAVVAAVAVLQSSGEPGARSSRIVTPLRFNALAGVDHDGGAVRSVVPVPGRLGHVAVGAGAVWVASEDARTVSQVDPRSLRVRRTLPTAVFPSDLAAGGDSVYIVDGARRALVRIQPAYGRVTGRLRLPSARRERAPPTDRFELDPTAVAVGAGSVWISDGADRLVRVDARTMTALPSIPAGGPVTGVAVGFGAVWAITAPAGVIRVDPRTGRVTDRISVASRATADAPYPVAVATGAGFVWVLEANTATVRKIEPRTGAVVATTPVGVDRSPTSLAAGDDAAWVGNADGTLTRIDAGSGAVRTITVGHGLRDVAVGDDVVWVTNQLTRCCGQE